MDPFPREARQEARRVLVRVYRHPRRGLGRPVEALRVGCADVDPGAQRARQIADPDRRLVGLGEPPGELDAVRELERIRQDPRDQVLPRLGRMPCDPKRHGLVDATVRIREVDVEGVDGRAECHARSG